MVNLHVAATSFLLVGELLQCHLHTVHLFMTSFNAVIDYTNIKLFWYNCQKILTTLQYIHFNSKFRGRTVLHLQNIHLEIDSIIVIYLSATYKKQQHILVQANSKYIKNIHTVVRQPCVSC